MLKQVQHDGNMLVENVIARNEAPEPRNAAKASKRSEIISIHFMSTFDNFTLSLEKLLLFFLVYLLLVFV